MNADAPAPEIGADQLGDPLDERMLALRQRNRFGGIAGLGNERQEFSDVSGFELLEHVQQGNQEARLAVSGQKRSAGE